MVLTILKSQEVLVSSGVPHKNLSIYIELCDTPPRNEMLPRNYRAILAYLSFKTGETG